MPHDGLPLLFAVNTIAPYILTCVIQQPKRLIYLNSGIHRQGEVKSREKLPGKYNHITYSDTKLHGVMLAMAVSRKWPAVFSNAVDPGWVPTKMGGASAPDSLEKGYETQVWLAVSDELSARVSGRYFHHKKEQFYSFIASDRNSQLGLISLCEQITGVLF